MKSQQNDQQPRKRWTTVIIVVLLLSLAAMLVASLFSAFPNTIASGNVALIKIYGPITTTDSGSFTRSATASTDIVDLIEKADKNPSIKAIVLEINSPGGSPVASDEIGQAVKSTAKPTVAWIREIGASGGYWIASATDHIIANRMSITGSIGVIGSYLEVADLMNRYNVTYRRLVSGKYKDIGTPYKELDTEEEQLFQNVLDELRGYFVAEVAEGRHLDKEKVEELATGMFYLGSTAKEMGLVDELGGKSELKAYLEKQINATPTFAEYKTQKSILDILSQFLSEKSFSVGQGIGDRLLQEQQVKVRT